MKEVRRNKPQSAMDHAEEFGVMPSRACYGGGGRMQCFEQEGRLSRSCWRGRESSEQLRKEGKPDEAEQLGADTAGIVP